MSSSSAFFKKQISIVPRWIIFTLDLVISLLSLTVAYLIKYNFDLSTLNYVEFSENKNFYLNN